jgi:diacylglycerol O-acyltransferase / wax synthase
MTRRRLSGMDALSLHTEMPTMPAHMVVVITFDASEQLSHERLHKLAGSSLPQLARFRSRLVGKPLGMGQPVWAEINHFDPARQLHRLAVPAPGGPAEFADLIAKLTTRPLVRDKPLWQAWSIEGLEDSRWALAIKMSQAMTDGSGGQERSDPGMIQGVGSILARLLTVAPDDDPTTYLLPEPGLGGPRSVVGLAADTAMELAENQLTGVRLSRQPLPGVLRAAVQRLRGGNGRAGDPVPRTVFNEALTRRRAVAFGSVPQAELSSVAEAFQVSADDVFLAACTLSLRTWLQRHHGVPQYPLVMQTQLWSTQRIRLPVQLDDPVTVLTELHAQTERLKTERDTGGQKHGPALDLPAVAALVPPNFVRAGMQLYTGLARSRRVAPTSHGTAAGIAGPPVPVYCAGAQVVGIHAVLPLVEGAGLNITMVSHDQTTDVSVSACPDHVPGVEAILDGIVGAVKELRGMRKKKNRPKKH